MILGESLCTLCVVCMYCSWAHLSCSVHIVVLNTDVYILDDNIIRKYYIRVEL